jgi:hypothetical protein
LFAASVFSMAARPAFAFISSDGEAGGVCSVVRGGEVLKSGGAAKAKDFGKAGDGATKVKVFGKVS